MANQAQHLASNSSASPLNSTSEMHLTHAVNQVNTLSQHSLNLSTSSVISSLLPQASSVLVGGNGGQSIPEISMHARESRPEGVLEEGKSNLDSERTEIVSNQRFSDGCDRGDQRTEFSVSTGIAAVVSSRINDAIMLDGEGQAKGDQQPELGGSCVVKKFAETGAVVYGSISKAKAGDTKEFQQNTDTGHGAGFQSDQHDGSLSSGAAKRSTNRSLTVRNTRSRDGKVGTPYGALRNTTRGSRGANTGEILSPNVGASEDFHLRNSDKIGGSRNDGSLRALEGLGGILPPAECGAGG